MGHDALLAGVENWLPDQALRDVDVASLFAALCERLRAIGLPLDRAMLSWPTLHPVWRSEQLVWTPGAEPELSRFGREWGVSTQFVASPMRPVLTPGSPSLRRRIEGPGAAPAFPAARAAGGGRRGRRHTAAAAADAAVASNAARPAPDFGVGPTVGAAMCGDGGVPERPNGHAIGPAVNAGARVERRTRRAGRPVLAAADVAAAEPGRWDALGPVALDGLPEPLALFARR